MENFMKEIIAKAKADGDDVNNAIALRIHNIGLEFQHLLDVGRNNLPHEAGIALSKTLDELDRAEKSISSHPRQIDGSGERPANVIAPAVAK